MQGSGIGTGLYFFPNCQATSPRSSSFATEEATFLASDTLSCRVWADAVDPAQVTQATAYIKQALANGSLVGGGTVYTIPLTWDAAKREWRGSFPLSGVNLTKGNWWRWNAVVADSLGHNYATPVDGSPTSPAFLTVSTGAYFKIVPYPNCYPPPPVIVLFPEMLTL